MKIVGDEGVFQKNLLKILIVMNFVHSFNNFSLFYIFYPPNYLCLSAATGLYTKCNKEKACAPESQYIFSDRNCKKKLKAWVIILICPVMTKSLATI